MTKIPFIKMHGLGNDFVIIQDSVLTEVDDVQEFVIKISNRNTGIGCDQFITYSKLSKDNSITMTIFNQDGSNAKACGNASRCLSRLIFDKYQIGDICLNVSNKKIYASYVDPDNITVNMGKPDFQKGWMPKQEDLWQVAEKYMIEPKELMLVDVGNPHLVIFTKLSDKDKKIIGRELQKHPLFPNGINVNFVKIEHNVIHLKVWERGTGFTLACGSGACASFMAADKLGFARDVAVVQFESGFLKMQKRADKLLMTGPAAYVCAGDYYL